MPQIRIKAFYICNVKHCEGLFEYAGVINIHVLLTKC